MKMRSISIVLAAFAGAACTATPPEVEECKQFVEARLKAPTTFRPVAVTTSNHALSLEDYLDARGGTWSKKDVVYKTMQEDKWGLRMVHIEYDAANTFGTPIREKQSCAFTLRNGQLPPETTPIKDKVKLRINQLELQRHFEEEFPQVNPRHYACCL